MTCLSVVWMVGWLVSYGWSVIIPLKGLQDMLHLHYGHIGTLIFSFGLGRISVYYATSLTSSLIYPSITRIELLKTEKGWEKDGIAKGQTKDSLRGRISYSSFFIHFFYPFALRLLSVSYPFAIPSFSYPFSVFSSRRDANVLRNYDASS